MLKFAYSPCPNDTFSFYAWLHGKLENTPPFTPVYGDIQHLNEWAIDGLYPISKVSFFTLGHLLNEYVLLPTGSALGKGNGPKVIAKENFPPDALKNKRIAIPGQNTSAHFYSQLLLPEPLEKVFCLYNEVEELIDQGVVDCGLIIHETRFTFEEAGFVEIADLGALWEARYHLPLPLGGIVAKRSLGEEKLQELNLTIQKSIAYAFKHPEETHAYIQEHSQIQDLGVTQAHIDLYVNQESLQLSTEGMQAIELMLQLGQEHNIFPSIPSSWSLPCPI